MLWTVLAILLTLWLLGLGLHIAGGVIHLLLLAAALVLVANLLAASRTVA
jgi:hypothetical protein